MVLVRRAVLDTQAPLVRLQTPQEVVLQVKVRVAQGL